MFKKFDNKTGYQSDPASSTNRGLGVAAKRRLTIASLVVGVAASAVLAAPAQATTESSGCTVKPEAPKVWNLNPDGSRNLDYPLTITCKKGRLTVTVEQQLWENDGNHWYDRDDLMGTAKVVAYFPSPGTQHKHTIRKLKNTDSDGAEEPYQVVRFRVTSGPVTSAPTKWERGPWVRIYY